jgi:hypothetical protein
VREVNRLSHLFWEVGCGDQIGSIVAIELGLHRGSRFVFGDDVEITAGIGGSLDRIDIAIIEVGIPIGRTLVGEELFVDAADVLNRG